MKSYVRDCIGVALLVLSVSVSILAQETPPAHPTVPAPADTDGAPLTLGEAVRRALERGFDLELQSYPLQNSRDDVLIAQSAFSPTLTANAGKNVASTAATDVLPVTTISGVTSGVNLQERLPTGTSVGIGTNLNRIDTSASATSLYDSGVTLSLTQPLLRGFGRRVTTAGVRSAEIGLNNAQRTYLDGALSVIQQTEKVYYGLAGAREQLAVVRASLTLAEKLLQEAQGKHRAGMATKLDELQAEVGVASARNNVLLAQSAAKSAEDSLLALLGRFEFDRTLGPAVLDDREADPSPRVEIAYAYALAHQPAYLNALANIDLAKISLQTAQDRLKPELDLSVGFNFNGADTSTRAAFDNAFIADNRGWQAGLALTYPLGRMAEKAQFRQARSTLSQQELGVEQLGQNILVQVRGAVRDVATSEEAVKLASQSVDLSARQYELENARFKAGLSTGRIVLQAQDDLEKARVALVQAKLNRRMSYSALRRIEGSGLERYGIELRLP